MGERTEDLPSAAWSRCRGSACAFRESCCQPGRRPRPRDPNSPRTSWGRKQAEGGPVLQADRVLRCPLWWRPRMGDRKGLHDMDLGATAKGSWGLQGLWGNGIHALPSEACSLRCPLLHVGCRGERGHFCLRDVLRLGGWVTSLGKKGCVFCSLSLRDQRAGLDQRMSSLVAGICCPWGWGILLHPEAVSPWLRPCEWRAASEWTL